MPAPGLTVGVARPAGVGAYTGNAIASIACGERAAVVDANVVRVLARLRRIAGDPKASTKLHAALAGALLDPGRPGDFNQVCWGLLRVQGIYYRVSAGGRGAECRGSCL